MGFLSGEGSNSSIRENRKLRERTLGKYFKGARSRTEDAYENRIKASKDESEETKARMRRADRTRRIKGWITGLVWLGVAVLLMILIS